MSSNANKEISSKLLELMTKLQPDSNKKEKKSTYKEILLFVNSKANDLSEDDLRLLFTGDDSDDKKIQGLCDLVGKKNSTGKFKDSTRQIVSILHDLMFLSKRQSKFREEFAIYEDYIKNMQLGEHYSVNKGKDNSYAKKILDLIQVVIDKRPGLDFSEFIRRAYIDEVKKGLDEHKKEKKKEEETQFQKSLYVDKLVSETSGSISLEPKTWDDVVKLKNKKLLTTEFLTLQVNYNPNSGNTMHTFIDEDKELEEEIVNNFVDPLTKFSKKLNFLSFTEEDRKKMHLQYDTFDPVFFLEKLYAEVKLKEFSDMLDNLEENISNTNLDDGNLIDKNIYKYLDCKKLLDFLVEKFRNSTHSTLDTFKGTLLNLQGRINTSLNPLKTSFDLILKSKSSKEIILKFSKFFLMKEKIEHYLKFSNFEELADYLKKINVEIKEISQNRYIYGEFYEFFSKTIEHFKSVLIKIITESSVNELVIKHFRYLLEFDVDAETVDSLLNGLKEKMCEKIKNDLEYTENFEIRNFKEFFCDEFNVENLNEEIFSENLKQAEMAINSGNINSNFNNSNPFDESTLNESSLNLTKEKQTLNQDSLKKKNLINVESIIKTLYNEIKDFLFMMKVLEENINLKIIHLSSQKNTKFSTIVTQVYFTLFEKLKEFLFLSDFDMQEIIENNFNESKINQIFNKNLHKTSETKNFVGELEGASEEDQNFKNSGQENNCSKNTTDKFIFKNNLISYYKTLNITTANTIFNENFNKNALQNLSNLIVDLFDLFEIYLDKDTLEALNESKTVTIEKIFFAFLNEKIISCLNICNEENTINFFDTHLSIFNYSSFSFTKVFLKNIFKSYKNIIEFYRNILIKTKDVMLDHQVIYDSLFYLLKSFLLKFFDFYKTEENGPEDYKRLNCLILEILKNYNYLKLEIKTILKNIFRNKSTEYGEKLEDLENFLNLLKGEFVNCYIKNAGKIMVDLFVGSLQKDISGIGTGPTMVNTCISFSSFSFYEKYNDLLLYDFYDINNISQNKGNNIPIFSDVRSCLIDIIINLAESIKVFYQLEQENLYTFSTKKNINIFENEFNGRYNSNYSNYNSNQGNKETNCQILNEKLVKIISEIILDFFEALIKNLDSNPIFKIIPLDNLNYDFNEKLNSCYTNKLLSQIYLEIELFQSILNTFLNYNNTIHDKIKNVRSFIFDRLLFIKKRKDAINSGNADESVIYSIEELERKKKVIEDYSFKYSAYFKCFKIKL